MLACFIPLLIDFPSVTFPELQTLLTGQKVREGLTLYSQLVHSAGWIAGWFNAFTSMLFGEVWWARHLVALLIAFFQACFIGIIFIEKKAFTEVTYIPSLLYGILFFFSFETFSLTPLLLGVTLLLFALRLLFNEVEFREQRDEGTYALGLLIGLASLCEFSLIVFMPASLLVMALFTRRALRKYILMLVGTLLPHMLLFAWYFVSDNLGDLWAHYYRPHFMLPAENLLSLQNLMLLAVVPIVYLFVSFLMLTREARLSKYQSQLVQVMFLWLIAGVCQILFARTRSPQNLIVLFSPICFFISHFFTLIRRRKFAEINIWIFFLGTVLSGYGFRYFAFDKYYGGIIAKANPVQEISGKRILVLDNNTATYLGNKLATGFADWRLSAPYFASPGYYEHVIRIGEELKRDPPEVIIDPHDRMSGVLKYLPKLEENYVKRYSTYIRKN